MPKTLDVYCPNKMRIFYNPLYTLNKKGIPFFKSTPLLDGTGRNFYSPFLFNLPNQVRDCFHI